MTYQQTPNGTNRLFLYRNEMPKNLTQLSMLFVTLDLFSKWGGFDKNEDDYMCWEFDSSITEKVIRQALLRGGCVLSKT